MSDIKFETGKRYIVTLKSGETLIGECVNTYKNFYNVQPDGDRYENFVTISVYEEDVFYNKTTTYKVPFCNILSYAEV